MTTTIAPSVSFFCRRTLSSHSPRPLHNVFIPICRLFREEGVLKFFPGNTASELYVEVMTHKYYLSQTQHADVGIIHAMREYARQFEEPAERDTFWDQLARKTRELLGSGSRILLGVVE